MLAFLVVEIMIPLRSKYRNQFLFRITLQPDEKKHYDDKRNHNITLASFTIVAIAVIVALPRQEVQKHVGALFYLSISMFLFFIASYLVDYRSNRFGPYIAKSFEYTGIMGV